MNFVKTHITDVAHLNNHPTKHKLIIAAAGATLFTAGVLVSKLSKKNVEVPTETE